VQGHLDQRRAPAGLLAGLLTATQITPICMSHTGFDDTLAAAPIGGSGARVRPGLRLPRVTPLP